MGRVAQAKFLPLCKLAMRAMVLDPETMISTEAIRKQLTDPEELRKITRDFDAEEAAHAAAATRDDEWDPFDGPPRGLSYFPRGAETFTCFKPDRRTAAARPVLWVCLTTFGPNVSSGGALCRALGRGSIAPPSSEPWRRRRRTARATRGTSPPMPPQMPPRMPLPMPLCRRRRHSRASCSNR